jgi:hypothetical protein
MIYKVVELWIANVDPDHEKEIQGTPGDPLDPILRGGCAYV